MPSVVLTIDKPTVNTILFTKHHPFDPHSNAPAIIVLDLLFTGEENEIQKVCDSPRVVQAHEAAPNSGAFSYRF